MAAVKGRCGMKAAGTSRGHMAAVACVGALGLLAGAAWTAIDEGEGLSYLSNDPQACVNCHIMRDQFDGWQKAGHHQAATCNDCHVPHDLVGKYLTKAEHGFRHSKGFTFQDFHEPIQIKPSSRQVVVDNCVRCHEGAVQDIKNVWSGAAAGESGGGSHGLMAGALDCLHCHASVGHGPRR